MYLTFTQRLVAGERYETRVVVRPDGSAQVQLGVKTLSGLRILASSPVGVVRVEPGVPVHLRHAVVGAGSSQLAASVWVEGQAVPARWQVTAQDSTGSLQGPGAVSVEPWLGAASSAVRLSVDSWRTEKVTALPSPTPGG